MKILIVDDEKANLNVLLDYLHNLGYKVLIAPDGEQALHQIQHGPPDLILLDVMMPGIDGFETCRRLKANEATRDIPVIFITALADTEDKVRGLEAGGVDYITKPFHYEEVIARVKIHLTICQLQQELRKQNAALREVNASKDKFFSIIAHDLRGPLGTLRELPELMLANIERYSKRELLSMIIAQKNTADNLLALLDNLLTWGRIQRGLIEYYPQPVDIKNSVAQNIALLTPNARQKQITLTSLVQESIMTYADSHMVNTIIRNLLSNALKFTNTHGMVTVSATPEEPFVEIAVSDTGVGIAPENLAKLFRIDAKFKRSGTANEQGTGLGLILCKEFVEKNGGKIRMESDVGKGTTVRLTLPGIKSELK